MYYSQLPYSAEFISMFFSISIPCDRLRWDKSKKVKDLVRTLFIMFLFFDWSLIYNLPSFVQHTTYIQTSRHKLVYVFSMMNMLTWRSGILIGRMMTRSIIPYVVFLEMGTLRTCRWQSARYMTWNYYFQIVEVREFFCQTQLSGFWILSQIDVSHSNLGLF